MNTPSERLIPVLHTIEIGVAIGCKIYPGLKGKDIEYVYDAFHTFFKNELKGKDSPEPASTSKAKDEVIDIIFQQLEGAEEEGVFDELLDGSFAPGGKPVESVEELYVMAFRYLTKSARLWRKKDGERGYLKGPIRDLGEIQISPEDDFEA